MLFFCYCGVVRVPCSCFSMFVFVTLFQCVYVCVCSNGIVLAVCGCGPLATQAKARLFGGEHPRNRALPRLCRPHNRLMGSLVQTVWQMFSSLCQLGLPAVQGWRGAHMRPRVR